MIARLTFFNAANPTDVEDFKKMYREQILPVIRNQKGNLGAWLLEPMNEKDQFISLTEWISMADAEQYESSGTYLELVNKVKSRFAGDYQLRTYNIADTRILTPTA
ncbi:MAG TPA: antibiotic biosynthesis monooxygenase [Puia sp.]|nr:antibiotic biosynthesis monooxygenase [Puia sp.]